MWSAFVDLRAARPPIPLGGGVGQRAELTGPFISSWASGAWGSVSLGFGGWEGGLARGLSRSPPPPPSRPVHTQMFGIDLNHQRNCLHIAVYADQDVHVWSALLTCVSRSGVRGQGGAGHAGGCREQGGDAARREEGTARQSRSTGLAAGMRDGGVWAG